MRRPPPRAIAISLAALALCSHGCRYEAELVVAPDGSGHGHLEVIGPPPGVGTGDLIRQLERSGFRVDHAAWVPPDRLEADLHWRRFDEAFRHRQVNPGGSVTLDFGLVEQGVLTVGVPGRIDPGDTSGAVRDVTQVVFHAGRAQLTYQPPSTPLHLAVVATLVAVGLMAVWALRQARHAGRPVEAAGNTCPRS